MVLNLPLNFTALIKIDGQQVCKVSSKSYFTSEKLQPGQEFWLNNIMCTLTFDI